MGYDNSSAWNGDSARAPQPRRNTMYRSGSTQRSGDRASRRFAWACGVAATLCLFASHGVASAADARTPQRLTQYSHTAWRAQDGFFNRPNAIAQSADGYLWIGTKAGLVRFDGVQFVAKNEYAGTSLGESSVEAVAAGADGSIWIGLERSVSHITDGVLTQFPVNGRAVAFRIEQSGALWVFETRTRGSDGPVVKIDGGVATSYPRPGGFLYSVQGAERNGPDQFWLGGTDALCDWSPARPARCFLMDKLAPFKGLIGIAAIHTSSDGALWVGIAQSGPGLGLGQFANEQWVPYDVPGLRGDSIEVSSIFEDRAGSIWVGTFNKGVFRIRAGVAEHFGKEDGLSDDEVQVNGIFEDRDGIIWVVTTSGLDQFRERSVSVFSTREGLSANSVESVLPRRDGGVWIASTKLSTLKNGMLIPPPHAELYGEKRVTSMLEDHTGSLWIGLGRTLSVITDDTKTEITAGDGGDVGIVSGIVEDVDKDLWVLIADKPQHLLRVRSMRVADAMDLSVADRALSLSPNPEGGILLGFSSGNILAVDKDGSRLIHSDADRGSIEDIAFGNAGELTVASSTGLYVQPSRDDEGLRHVPGLPCRSLISAAWDGEARLWLNSTCGVIRIEAVDWNEWVRHPEHDIPSTLFDAAHGAEPGKPSFRPRSGVAADGTVWFATGSVAQSIDGARTQSGISTPDVMVQEITADKVTKSAVNGIQLPPVTRDIEIRYTAIAFAMPQKTKFMYRLEGRDESWQDAGNRRQAFYTDLSPGHYVFSVKASSAAGTWGDRAASFTFDVLPAYYQTRWFAVICGLALIGILYVAYVVRLRQVAIGLKRRLKVKSDERERIARDLHDTLLQDTQALVFSFQTLADEFPPGAPIRERMEEALDRADRVLAEGRECVLDLRAHDALPSDLPEALARAGDELAKGGSQTFRSIIEGTPQSLEPMVRDEVYRIAREAMVNAFRHGQARAVEVQLIFAPDALTVRVRDDGKGIDQQTVQAGGREGHWGLRGMRERAERIGGQLQIWSGVKPGTEVQLEIPARTAYRSRRSAVGWSWLARLGVGGR